MPTRERINTENTNTLNNHHLQFGKALSAALFVLLLVAVGTTNALAQTQVATLQHGDDVSAFYGANAFVEAHTAAADGDIVTLSSGTFNAPSQITKAITLRGAGVVSDTVAGTAPTLLPGDVLINVAGQRLSAVPDGGHTDYLPNALQHVVQSEIHEMQLQKDY